MRVVGFGLSKQFAEKLSEPQTQFSVNTGINIKDIQPVKVEFLKNEDALSFTFELKITYEKEVAKITFGGNMIVAMDKKSASEVLKKWVDKKVPDMVRIAVFNFIMSRCTIKAMQFEDDFNLPKHIQIPQFRGSDESVESQTQPSNKQQHSQNSNKQNFNSNKNKK